MSALTVGALTVAAHHGKGARVDLSCEDSSHGVLNHARNPSYPRREVLHWWLIVPSALSFFSHDALSLQWASDAPVHLLDQERAA